jgi:hypothetical protein
MADIREDAIRYTMGVLRHAKDWQDGQTGSVITIVSARGSMRAAIAEAQSVIREAEDRLGDELPY